MPRTRMGIPLRFVPAGAGRRSERKEYPMTRHLSLFLMLVLITVGVSAASDKSTPTDADNGFAWKSEVPDDCPFERSQTLTAIFFTGRHSDYRCGDTWYPSWASDGNLYSPFEFVVVPTDVKGIKIVRLSIGFPNESVTTPNTSHLFSCAAPTTVVTTK